MLKAAPASHIHQLIEKGLDRCFLIFNAQSKAKKANSIIIDSRRMYRDWARIAVSENIKLCMRRSLQRFTATVLPNSTSAPASAPAQADKPSSQRTRYTTGVRREPHSAGTNLRLHNGTSLGYAIPAMKKSLVTLMKHMRRLRYMCVVLVR